MGICLAAVFNIYIISIVKWHRKIIFNWDIQLILNPITLCIFYTCPVPFLPCVTIDPLLLTSSHLLQEGLVVGAVARGQSVHFADKQLLQFLKGKYFLLCLPSSCLSIICSGGPRRLYLIFPAITTTEIVAPVQIYMTHWHFKECVLTSFAGH
jgi:hypothetical protein